MFEKKTKHGDVRTGRVGVVRGEAVLEDGVEGEVDECGEEG